MAPPSPFPVIKIVSKYIVASREGGGIGGGAKILQKIMAPPLSVIKIVKYCGVGGVALGAIKSYKDHGAPSPCHQDIVASGEGRALGGGGAPKSYKKIMAPPLSVINIVKYCVVGGGGGIGGAKILQI